MFRAGIFLFLVNFHIYSYRDDKKIIFGNEKLTEATSLTFQSRIFSQNTWLQQYIV